MENDDDDDDDDDDGDDDDGDLSDNEDKGGWTDVKNGGICWNMRRPCQNLLQIESDK